MINLVDISRAVSLILSQRFFGHKVYNEEVKDNGIRPCFYVDIKPTAAVMESKTDIVKSLMVNVQYGAKNLTNAENLTMIDNLNKLFTLKLRVNDRYLNIMEQKYKIVDHILHYSFTIEFMDDIDTLLTENTEQYEPAQEIYIKNM